MPTQYPITPGTLSSNCWTASPQTMLNEYSEKSYVTLNLTGVVISSTTPVVTDRDKLWVKTTAGGLPVGQFIYQGGLWVWPHEVPASGSERRLWVGTSGALDTYDGGAAGTVGDASGPFWTIDTNMAGLFPVGVGTLSPSGTVLAVTDTGGADQVTPLEANLPAHTHQIGVEVSTTSAGSENGRLRAASTNVEWQGTTAETAVAVTRSTGYDSTAVTPIDTAPPYYAVYFIQRTARIYRTSS